MSEPNPCPAPTRCPMTACQSEDVVTEQRGPWQFTYCRACKGISATSEKYLSDEDALDSEAMLWDAKRSMGRVEPDR